MATVKPWIRLYTEVPSDPKVQRLPDKMFRFWVNCLCLAGKYDGVLPSDEDISWILKLDLPTVKERLEALVNAGLLDTNERNCFIPHGWAHRQYESDVSTGRVQKFRKRSMKRDGNVSETANETDRAEQSITEQNRTEQSRADAADVSISKSPEPTEEEKRFWISKTMLDFPGARIIGKLPDERIVEQCYKLAGGDMDLLGKAFRALFLTGKKPEHSWGWFPKVLPDYVRRARQ